MQEFPFEVERYELAEPPAYLFRATRRDFLAGIGAGLLVLSLPHSAEAQRAGAAPLHARLHIGEDGAISVLSGKIEEGQGPRTELAAAAAEELRLPITRIRVVLADTSLVPNDGITAGSRTTPSTVPAVRGAAAALRELLVQHSARRWSLPPAQVQIRDGAARGPETGQSLTYAELAKSPEFAEAVQQSPATAPLTPIAAWQTLGQPFWRTDAREIVTGAHQYPSDIQRPGMLYGSMLRPPSFEAQLVSLDEAAIKSHPGVTVVRDGQFVGCTAPTSFAARKAVEALAAAATWKEKAHPSSEELFPYLRNNARTPADAPDPALTASPQRRQATYQAAYIQHAPMEPRAAVAGWENGKLTVWTGTSNPFAVRDQLAQAFRIPAASIRVIVPDMGGGFGGKHTGEAALEAARLAREVQRPVHLRWTRAEEFTWAYCRPAALIDVDAALDQDNNIAHWRFVNYNAGRAAIETPYRTAKHHIQFVPTESPLRQGSYRALGSTANNFARECHIDELAAAAGLDPLAFRLRHLDNGRIRAVLEAAAAKFRWAERSRQRTPNRGVGLACGTEKDSVVAACVEVEVDPQSGIPRLLEICEAYECGAILNPANLRAQVEGAIIMGIGGALREQLLFANGKLQNARFSAYPVPRFRDLPKMDIVLLDRKDAPSNGAGETPLIVVAPAMANAIHAATGQRIRTLPFPPARK